MTSLSSCVQEVEDGQDALPTRAVAVVERHHEAVPLHHLVAKGGLEEVAARRQHRGVREIHLGAHHEAAVAGEGAAGGLLFALQGLVEEAREVAEQTAGHGGRGARHMLLVAVLPDPAQAEEVGDDLLTKSLGDRDTYTRYTTYVYRI